MNSNPTLQRLWFAPTTLNIEWADGKTSEFASLWLRDNLSEDRDAFSGQRLIDIADLPENPRISRAAATPGGSIEVAWEGEPRTASFNLEWLRAHTDRPELTRKLWLEGRSLDPTNDFGWAKFAAAKSDRPVRSAWQTRLLQEGIAFLSEVPPGEESIFAVAALAGRVMETNYGLVYDVRSVPQPENLAYSDLGLGLHTDNPYREPVPGFQILHALVTAPEGGDSLFADGFAIAEHLRAVAPKAFTVLTQTAIPFQYRSKDAELYAERPLIQLNCSGEVSAVHYNSRSIAPLRLAANQVDPFYAAYRAFAALLRDPRFQLQYKLRDGDAVVFDNQRTLHGRSAFSSARHPRHLRGCYLTRDSVYSEAALSRREPRP